MLTCSRCHPMSGLSLQSLVRLPNSTREVVIPSDFLFYGSTPCRPKVWRIKYSHCQNRIAILIPTIFPLMILNAAFHSSQLSTVNRIISGVPLTEDYIDTGLIFKAVGRCIWTFKIISPNFDAHLFITFCRNYEFEWLALRTKTNHLLAVLLGSLSIYMPTRTRFSPQIMEIFLFLPAYIYRIASKP